MISRLFSKPIINRATTLTKPVISSEVSRQQNWARRALSSVSTTSSGNSVLTPNSIPKVCLFSHNSITTTRRTPLIQSLAVLENIVGPFPNSCSNNQNVAEKSPLVQLDSVLRKRRKKMNKHKLQKRRKLERRAHKR
jgi:hypothetical protein